MSKIARTNPYSLLADGRLGLRTLRQVPEPEQRIVWFPFGGGSSHLFSKVAAALPQNWSVWAVDSPGHLRTGGELLPNIGALCNLYMTHLDAAFLSGVWLAGHSLGALVAAYLASELESRKQDAAGCIVCAACPPALIGTNRALSGMTDQQLRARWESMLPRDYGVADPASLFDILVPIIRADILAFESCTDTPLKKLCRTPLLAVAGQMDAMVPISRVQAWLEWGSAASFTTIAEAGHLFVLSHAEALAQLMVSFVKEHQPIKSIRSTPGRSRASYKTSVHDLPAQSGDTLRLPEITMARKSGKTSIADLTECIHSGRSHLSALLLEHGAILFRGFGVVSAEMISSVVAGFGDAMVDYTGGNSPRLKVGNGVYTSTEHPAELEISPHPELCYEQSWPSRLYFACKQPAISGGATPLVDLRRLLLKLNPEVVDRFLERGLLYIRRLRAGKGLGLSWKATFGSNDPRVVEKMLLKRKADFQWGDQQCLLVRQRGPVIHRHFITGEKAWFNQAEQWHPSALPDFVREAVGLDLPHDISFADHTALSMADVAHIREKLWAQAAQFRWETGDLLVVDNERMAHGRRSFQGPRRILVSMGTEQALPQAVGC
ncbi:MAG TPA: alpha/beta fold hydrolase [Terriglobales bacterium]|nr:alpha/beta fold hydrolase [Terriglobales bacterium]